MSYNTVIQQGRFTADGSNKNISIRSGFDWIKVYNETAIAQGAADLGAEFYFQTGMTNGRGIVTTKLGTVGNDPLTIGQIAADSGFFVLDTTGNPLGSQVAVTAVTNVVRPIVSTGSTAGLLAGSIVRLYSLTAGKQNLNGYDFAVDTIVANTSFRIASALATAPGATAATGQYRIVKFNPMFYPSFRYIANITQAAQAVVTVTVPSLYKVGQTISFVIPNEEYGMIELNGLSGTVVAVNDTLATQTVTVDIDTTTFTPFVFPTAAQWANPLSKAMVIPQGMDTAQALAQSANILSDATNNEGMIGVTLVAGAASPAGQAADVIYWVAGKSFSVDNQ